MLGSQVMQVKNFETETFRDVEGDEIPKEKMLIFELAEQHPNRGPRLRHRAEDQVLPLRATASGRWQIQGEGIGDDQSRSEPAAYPFVGMVAGRRTVAVGRIIAHFAPTKGMQTEIDLDGGEITMLKALGTSGTPMVGKILRRQVSDMGDPEFVETLAGLMDRGYVMSSKVNVMKIEDVPHSFFRTNPSYSRDLRDAMRPGSRRDEKKEVFERYFLFVVDDASASIYRGFECVSPAEAAAMIAAGTAHRPSSGYVKYNMTSPLGYVSGPDRNAASWLCSREVRELTATLVSSPQWGVLLDLLHSIERWIPGARSRIIFWFSG